MAELPPERWPIATNQKFRPVAIPLAKTPRPTYGVLAVLSSAAKLFDGPLDLASVVGRISAFVVPNLADWYILFVPRRSDGAPLVAFAHHERECDLALGELVMRSPGPQWPARSALGTVLAHARLVWLPNATGADLCGWAARDMERLGSRSAVCLPIRSGGADPGALLAVRDGVGTYDAPQVELLQAVCERVSMALEAALQYESSRAGQQRAEEALAIAAHELRTPLAVLTAHTQLLKRRINTGPVPQAELRDSLEQIASQSRRVAAMVAKLLDCARISGGKFPLDLQEADLRALVENVVNAFHVGHPERRVCVEAPSGLRVRVDVGGVEEVVCNLLENASKFSPASAGIEITLAAVGTTSARVAVRDHGPGVAPRLRARIFEPFVQGHTPDGESGLGLGLHISRQLAGLHGGTLYAEYPTDGGSRFVVELPMA